MYNCITYLKVLIIRKINCNYVIDVNSTYCGDHCTIYTNIKSLCCVSETNSVIHQL